MSLIFWRKTADTGDPRARVTVAADETNPLPVQPLLDDNAPPLKVDVQSTTLPPLAGRTVTRWVQVPGIGTGSAYADGDAFGTLITWRDVLRPDVLSGTIVGAFLHDLDDEGLQVDLPLFTRSFTTTADNSAFAPSDADLLACCAVVSITSFYNWNSNQFGQATNLGIWVTGEGPNLYTQCVVRGAANIAAGAIPWVGLVILPD